MPTVLLFLLWGISFRIIFRLVFTRPITRSYWKIQHLKGCPEGVTKYMESKLVLEILLVFLLFTGMNQIFHVKMIIFALWHVKVIIFALDPNVLRFIFKTWYAWRMEKEAALARFHIEYVSQKSFCQLTSQNTSRREMEPDVFPSFVLLYFLKAASRYW